MIICFMIDLIATSIYGEIYDIFSDSKDGHSSKKPKLIDDMIR